MNEDLKDLDGELTHALRREEPSAGFADRVLNRVAEQPAAERHRPGRFGPGITGGFKGSVPQGVDIRENRSQLSLLQWAAAAALVVAVAGGVNYVAEQKERAEGEAARERVVLALHIAGAKLQLVQTKINQLHERPEKNSNQ